MSRKKIIKKILYVKDFKYNSILITLLINRVLKNGKKTLAKKIIYSALNSLLHRTKENPLKVLEKAIRNISPKVIIKNTLSKGNIIKTPILLNIFDSTILAIKWIIEISIKKNGKSMYIKLANEIFDAYKGVGTSIKKKEETHKIAKANKTFIIN